MRLASIFALQLVFVLLLTDFSQAQPDMVKKAKNEGKVVIYTTISTTDLDLLLKKFKEKYPGIETGFIRGNNEKILAKLQTESRAGQRNADVLAIAGIPALILKKNRMIQPYVSSEMQHYPDQFHDSQKIWSCCFYVTLNVVAYNSDLVKGPDIPRSYQDLLLPKWKGNLSLDEDDVEWFGGMLEVMGEEKGMTYFLNLARQNPRMVRGHTLQGQLLAAGEFAITVNQFVHVVEKVKAKQGPTDWAPDVRPVVTRTYPIMLSETAPHPNAGKLLIDFLLSAEAQSIINKVHRTSIREGVASAKLKSLNIHIPSEKVADNFGDLTSKYHALFSK